MRNQGESGPVSEESAAESAPEPDVRAEPSKDLTKIEAAEIEQRLRYLGYID